MTDLLFGFRFFTDTGSKKSVERFFNYKSIKSDLFSSFVASNDSELVEYSGIQVYYKTKSFLYS